MPHRALQCVLSKPCKKQKHDDQLELIYFHNCPIKNLYLLAPQRQSQRQSHLQEQKIPTNNPQLLVANPGRETDITTRTVFLLCWLLLFLFLLC